MRGRARGRDPSGRAEAWTSTGPGEAMGGTGPLSGWPERNAPRCTRMRCAATWPLPAAARTSLRMLTLCVRYLNEPNFALHSAEPNTGCRALATHILVPAERCQHTGDIYIQLLPLLESCRHMLLHSR